MRNVGSRRIEFAIGRATRVPGGNYIRSSGTREVWPITLILTTILILVSPEVVSQDLMSAITPKESATRALEIGNAFIAETKTTRSRKGAPEDVATFLHVRGQSQDVEDFIDSRMAYTNENTGEERAEARKQLRCLWWVAAPKLVEYLGAKNGHARNTARETLSMMRSEPVVDAIIGKLESTDDKEVWLACINTLGGMTEKFETGIEGRIVMGQPESRELANRIIKPFLEKVRSVTEDPELQKSIEYAFRRLEEEADRRLKQVESEEVPEKFRDLPMERPRN